MEKKIRLQIGKEAANLVEGKLYLLGLKHSVEVEITEFSGEIKVWIINIIGEKVKEFIEDLKTLLLEVQE